MLSECCAVYKFQEHLFVLLDRIIALARCRSVSQMHIDWFSRFSRAYVCCRQTAWHTDRLTDRQWFSDCSNIGCIQPVLRCGLIMESTSREQHYRPLQQWICQPVALVNHLLKLSARFRHHLSSRRNTLQRLQHFVKILLLVNQNNTERKLMRRKMHSNKYKYRGERHFDPPSISVLEPLWLLHITSLIVMVALWNRADHYIFALWLLLSFFFLFLT